MAERAPVTYERIAGEYYDSVRHPTSSALREASVAAFKEWNCTPEFGLALEVGAGQTILQDQPCTFDGALILLDNSRTMLLHSAQTLGTHPVLALAELMPFKPDSFDIIIAILGDPYNVGTFWTETARILKGGGRAFFSTPSFEWASTYRSHEHTPIHVASFMDATDEIVQVPSFVYPIETQIRMIEKEGLIVERVIPMDRAVLDAVPSKIAIVPDVPIVTAFFIRKRSLCG